MLQYNYLIVGIPTWNTGELQDDWDVFLPNFREMNMSGKQVAIFGLGDQNGYGFNFLDAAGILANEVLLTGATLFGLWSNEKYQFNESKAKQDEYFLCLGVDQEGQEKVETWMRVLIKGSYDSRYQLQFRGHYFRERYGIEILSLFIPENTDIPPIWVDRGWMPAGNSAKEAVAIPAPPNGSLIIRGVLRQYDDSNARSGVFFALPVTILIENNK